MKASWTLYHKSFQNKEDFRGLNSYADSFVLITVDRTVPIPWTYIFIVPASIFIGIDPMIGGIPSNWRIPQEIVYICIFCVLQIRTRLRNSLVY